ncbi:hypothetical protein EsH8_X_000450 [Colletotrichum jinshuiense]
MDLVTSFEIVSHLCILHGDLTEIAAKVDDPSTLDQKQLAVLGVLSPLKSLIDPIIERVLKGAESGTITEKGIPQLVDEAQKAIKTILEHVERDDIVWQTIRDTFDDSSQLTEDNEFIQNFLALSKSVEKLSVSKAPQLPPLPTELHEEIDAAEYQYTPLATATSIRLLTIEKDDGGTDIRLSFETVDLEEHPVYETLSYTWGKPCTAFRTVAERDRVERADIPVLCDGRSIKVQENLYRYLQNWRQAISVNPQDERVKLAAKQNLSPPKRLWIDALCINQSDNAEKNQQVAMMGRIYKDCAKVHIWLGAEDDFSRRGIELLCKLAVSFPKITKPLESMSQEEICKEADLPDTSSWPWICLWAFLNRAWFRRTWVIQEIALAPFISVACGSLTFPWMALTNGHGFMSMTGLYEMVDASASVEISGPGIEVLWDEDGNPVTQEVPRTQESRKLFWAEDYHKIRMGSLVGLMANIRHADRSMVLRDFGHNRSQRRYPDLRSDSLTQLFHSGRMTSCWNPRDRVYALLELAKRDFYAEKLDPRRQDIEVKYQDTVAQVYLDAAWFILLSGSSLELLSRATTWTERVDLDSNDSSNLATDQSQEGDIGSDIEQQTEDNGIQEKDTKTPMENLTKADNSEGEGIKLLPSWVPDWTVISNDSALQSFSERFSLGWAAAGKRQWKPPSEEELYKPFLTVEGACVGKICEIADHGDLLMATEISMKLPKVYEWTDGGQSPLDVLWRTLIHDTISGQHPAPEQWALIFDKVIMSANREGLLNWQRDNFSVESEKVYNRWIKAWGKFSKYMGDRSKNMDFEAVKDDPLVKKYQESMKESSSSPVLFRTENGMLGQGPRGIRPGDLVYIIAGVAAPAILRNRTNARFGWTGQAYVHGIMHGEAMDNFESHFATIQLE